MFVDVQFSEHFYIILYLLPEAHFSCFSSFNFSLCAIYFSFPCSCCIICLCYFHIFFYPSPSWPSHCSLLFFLHFFKLFFHVSLFYSLESPYSSFSNSLFPPSLSYCLLLLLSTLSTYSYYPPPWSSSMLWFPDGKVESFYYSLK